MSRNISPKYSGAENFREILQRYRRANATRFCWRNYGLFGKRRTDGRAVELKLRCTVGGWRGTGTALQKGFQIERRLASLATF